MIRQLAGIFFGYFELLWGVKGVQRVSRGDLLCPFAALLVPLEVSYSIGFGFIHPIMIQLTSIN